MQTLHLWRDMALLTGAAMASHSHRHFAVQLIVALDGRFSLRADARSDWRAYGGAWIPSRAWHQTRAEPASVVMAYLHPQSAVARALACETGGVDAICALPAPKSHALSRALRAAANDPAAARAAIEAAFLNGTDAAAISLDARLEHVAQLIDDGAPEARSLVQLADRVHLSPHRLRHVFREQFGLPLAAYRLWSRLARAVRQLAAVPDLTGAAHASGFSDSAHFSHAFRQVFGLTPSEVFKSEDFVVQVCD